MIAFMKKLISLVGITGEGEIEFLSAKFSGTTWSVVVESYLTAKTQNRGMFVIRYMQPLVSKVPVMVVEGDHEIEQQAGNQTFAAYNSRFAFPSEESGSSSSLFYSFNAGGIHFVMLGAYTSYDKSGHNCYPKKIFSLLPVIVTS